MPEVIVYSTPTCSNCDAAKKFLKEKGVNYKEVNVARDIQAAERIIKMTGQSAVPVIEIDGEFIVGFDKKRMIETLGL